MDRKMLGNRSIFFLNCIKKRDYNYNTMGAGPSCEYDDYYSKDVVSQNYFSKSIVARDYVTKSVCDEQKEETVTK